MIFISKESVDVARQQRASSVKVYQLSKNLKEIC